MKGKNDSGESLPPDQSLAKTDITPDASSMASFLQQEKMCKVSNYFSNFKQPPINEALKLTRMMNNQNTPHQHIILVPLQVSLGLLKVTDNPYFSQELYLSMGVHPSDIAGKI